MSRRQITVLVSLPLAVLALGLLVVLALRPASASQQTCDAIELGMTEQQVARLMGRPADAPFHTAPSDLFDETKVWEGSPTPTPSCLQEGLPPPPPSPSTRAS